MTGAGFDPGLARRLLNEAWPSFVADETAAAAEELCLLYAAPARGPGDDHASLLVGEVERRGDPAAADLLCAAGRLVPGAVGRAAEAALARLHGAGVRGRAEEGIGALTLVEAVLIAVDRLELLAVHLRRGEEHRFGTIASHPHLLEGGLGPPRGPGDVRERFDQLEQVAVPSARTSAQAARWARGAFVRAEAAGIPQRERLAYTRPLLARALTGAPDPWPWLPEAPDEDWEREARRRSRRRPSARKAARHAARAARRRNRGR